MIKVFMASDKHSEWIATFDSEESYVVCYKELEKLASKHRCTIFESVIDEGEDDVNWSFNCCISGWMCYTYNKNSLTARENEDES